MLNHALLIDVAFSSFKSLMLILRSTLSLVFSSHYLVVELSHYHHRASTTKHSLIRGVLKQSCSTGAKNFTNYVFCGVIQNIENHCAISAKFWKNWFLLYKIGYFDNNRHWQIGVKMAQWFSIFWITPLNCGWQNT